jgi:Uma2 family endonuclease
MGVYSMPMSGELRYVQAPVPVHFPDTEQVPETKQHFRLRTLLYEFLALAFADRATIGSDQFMYWDPTDPKACLAPDAFVRLGEPDHLFRSWKVWERGAPQLAIEVISDSDERDSDWDAKLQRYRRLGVQELIRFDPEASEPTRVLRIWDAVEGNLAEREVSGTVAQSRVLPGHWVIVDDAALGPTLRLSHDVLGANLYLTASESAEARVRELEAELGRRGT